MISTILMLISSLLLWACEPEPIKTDGLQLGTTQKRLPGESYTAAEARYRNNLDKLNLDQYTDALSVISAAKNIDDLDLADLPNFGSNKKFVEAFEKIRDYRFLKSEDRPDVLRRSTWLYPDDGCFARGDLMARHLVEFGYQAVKKIFVFGELAVSTKNAVGGAVYWWFHIVPIALVDDEPMVMDPAVSPEEPLSLSDWIDLIAVDKGALTYSICSSYSYIPYSRCESISVGDKNRAIDDQQRFLEPEWQRLLSLGRDPASELGSAPPWNQ